MDEAPYAPYEDGDRVRRVPRWAKIGAFLFAGLIGAVGLALLALAWQGERSDRISLEHSLRDARTQIGMLQGTVTDLRGELAEAQDLANARGRVLAQTHRALVRVDPLLSSVDEVKLVASEIQADRDAFRDNANQLRGEMVDFTNYLIETPVLSYDLSYIESQITYLNGRLDEFDGAGASLDDRDRAYARASAHFDRRANAFSSAVRRLEKALKDVAD